VAHASHFITPVYTGVQAVSEVVILDSGFHRNDERGRRPHTSSPRRTPGPRRFRKLLPHPFPTGEGDTGVRRNDEGGVTPAHASHFVTPVYTGVQAVS